MRGCNAFYLLASLPVVLFAHGCKSQPDDCEGSSCNTRPRAVAHAPGARAAKAFLPTAYAVSPRAADMPPVESKPEQEFDQDEKIGPPKPFRVESPWAEPSQDPAVQNFSIE